MNIGYKADRKPVMILISVTAPVKTKIRVRVRDSKKPFSFYTNRYAHVQGQKTFYVRMPQSPEVAIIEVFNEAKGNMPEGQDRTFTAKIKEEALPVVDVFKSYNNNLKSFIKFAQQFSDRAGITSAGHSIYKSDDGQFRIDYLDVIRSRHDNRPLKTPARIAQKDGVIEISKMYFKNYTIPMRMAILLHEFSHFYLNKKQDSEFEADKNALIVYLGLGYPRIEAFQAFLEVFKGSPSEQNKQRHEAIKSFIESFENKKYKLVA